MPSARPTWSPRGCARCCARDERGLSQSTEQALLVAAAILVAGAIGIGVWNFVQSKLSGGGVTITGGP